jgi:hypothetical protein
LNFEKRDKDLFCGKRCKKMKIEKEKNMTKKLDHDAHFARLSETNALFVAKKEAKTYVCFGNKAVSNKSMQGCVYLIFSFFDVYAIPVISKLIDQPVCNFAKKMF